MQALTAKDEADLRWALSLQADMIALSFVQRPAEQVPMARKRIVEALLEIGRCDKGDMVVIVAGSPPGTPGRTNALRVHRIGDAAALGAGLG